MSAAGGDVAARSVIPRERLEQVARAWRDAGRQVVFTNGCFDLLHPGHLALLEASAAEGDVLLVAINGDASVTRLKGPGRPIYPAAERAELLLALRWVDAVTVFEEDTPRETIEMVRPQVLVKGAEYGAGAIVGEDLVVGGGGRVVRFAMKPGYSTSAVVSKMKERGSSAK
ncbi:MAG: adenylyltransferase/cytidyltransferase family protein [Candidatus Krumholzibacteria bacterium]|nr:adenylyltransferase/cytidyltransferase family protein [Candidatus Krumholzibacteria bacterium]MDH4338290.1 adenylyltransferase/cytidyltransferase family protein [Candidatus Krumholzibacteria bacterium]MDH5268923.1 adenylyltransferase/cytidyltransferase family protein [Candidatus Krumholzibacteria bacterium]